MSVATPDWLTRHAGALRSGVDGNSCVVLFANLPQYNVIPKPAVGQFACEVIQTINGKPLECPGTFATRAEALQGGLEVLRQALGW